MFGQLAKNKASLNFAQFMDTYLLVKLSGKYILEVKPFKMRALTTLLFICLFLQSNAQVFVGPKKIPTDYRTGSFSASDIQRLKSSTTIFVLQDKDFENINEWEKAIKSVWTVSPIKLVKRTELDQNKCNKCSYFTFGHYSDDNSISESSTSKLHMTWQHFSYDLWMPPSGKTNDDDDNETSYARILVYPEKMVFNYPRKIASSHDIYVNAPLYTTLLYNWQPFMLKGYLKMVNDLLISKETRSLYTDDEDKSALKILKTDTLYIPDYVNIKTDHRGEREAIETTDLKELNDNYPNPVRIVSTEELKQIILAASKPVYFLSFIKSHPERYLNVFDSKSNKSIFSRSAVKGTNFNYKHLWEIYRLTR